MGVLEQLDAIREERTSAALGEGLQPLPPIDTTPTVNPGGGMPNVPFRTRVFQGAMQALKYTGVPQVLGMTAEGLRKADQAFREGILTVTGKLPTETFKQRWNDTWDGKRKMSTREFLEFYIDASMMDELEDIPIIPGWTKEILTPYSRLAGETPKKKTVPRFNLAGALTLATDFFVTPFALPAALPVRATSGAARVVSKLPLTSPFRGIARGADAIITDQRGPIGAVLGIIREPFASLERFPHIPQAFLVARDKVVRKAHESAEGLHQLWEETVFRKKLGGLRKERIVTKQEEKRVMKSLFGLQAVKLTAREQNLEEKVLDWLTPKMHELSEQGHIKNWHRDKKLTQVFPGLVGKDSLPADIGQSWKYETLGLLGLPLRNQRKLQWKDENLELWVALRDFAYVADRKLVWNERARRVSDKGKVFFEDVGPLRRFAVRNPTTKRGGRRRKQKENPNLPEDMNPAEKHYLIGLINEIQGKGRGRHVLMLGEMHSRFYRALQGKLNENRIGQMFLKAGGAVGRMVDPERGYNLPEFSKPQIVSQLMTHNVVRSMLWGNFRAALQNTSQLINTAAIHGLPATVKGMFLLGNANIRRTAYREVGDEFRKIMVETGWQTRFGKLADDVMMAPFNFFENTARAVAFNIGIDDWVKTHGKRHGINSIDEVLQANPALRDQAIQAGMTEAYRGNFIYGVMGRAPALSGPIARPATSLLSFAPKTAEMLRREAKRDGGFMIRYLALNGWAINVATTHAGIAADEWLAWGFIPPTRGTDGIPVARSPQAGFLFDMVAGTSAVARGDGAAAEKFWRSASSSTGRVLEPFVDSTFARAVAAGLVNLGAVPVPVVAIDRVKKVAAEGFGKGGEEGRSFSATGESWVPISRQDAVRSAFFTPVIQNQRRKILQMQREDKIRLDAELDKRVRNFVQAMATHDGDGLMDAARSFVEPVTLGFGTGLRQTFRRTEQSVVYPPMEMIENRLKRAMQQHTISRDLLNMWEAGFPQHVLWAQWIQTIMDAPPELVRGAQE